MIAIIHHAADRFSRFGNGIMDLIGYTLAGIAFLLLLTVLAIVVVVSLLITAVVGLIVGVFK